VRLPHQERFNDQIDVVRMGITDFLIATRAAARRKGLSDIEINMATAQVFLELAFCLTREHYEKDETMELLSEIINREVEDAD